jgi:hypothetical protein
MRQVQSSAGTATDLHDALSLASDENSAMRWQKYLHDALSART